MVSFDLAGIVAAAWSATRQHSTTASAYVLATHELVLIREKLKQDVTEREWSTTVADAEAAITVEARSAMATLVEASSHVGAHVRAGGDDGVAGYQGSGGLSISRMALSGDGRILAYHSGVTESTQVHLYDTGANREITTLPVEGYGGHMQLSGDGRRLALMSIDSVGLWDVPSRSRVRVVDVVRTGHWERGAEFTDMALSPDGRWLATSQDQVNGGRIRVVVWDLASGSRATTLELGSARRAPAMRFTGDSSRLLLTHTTSGNQRTFEMAGATWTEPEPIPTMDDATMIPDASGNRAVTFTDGEIQIWDLRARSRLASHSVDAAYGDVEVSDDGRLVIVGTNTGQVIVYDDDLSQETRVTGHQYTVTDVAVSADGATFASTGEDGSVTWGRSRELNHRTVLPGADEAAVSLNGRVALRATDTVAEVWDVAMGERRGALPSRTEILISSDRLGSIDATTGFERLATLENDNGYLSMWDVQAGELIFRQRAISGGGRGTDTPNVRFLPDDRHLLAVTGLGPTVIDTHDYTVSQVLDLDEDAGGFVTSADGRVVAVLTHTGWDESTGDHRPYVVDVWRWRDSGRLDREHSGPLDVAGLVFSLSALDSDGSSMALQDPDGRVHVFDIDGGTRLSVLDAGLGGRSDGIAFNAGGDILVQLGTWAGQSSLLLWDVATGELLAPWSLPISAVKPSERIQLVSEGIQLVQGPDSTVVTVKGNGSINRWTVDVDHWRDRLCAIAGDDLAEGDRERYLSNMAVEAPCRRR